MERGAQLFLSVHAALLAAREHPDRAGRRIAIGPGRCAGNGEDGI